MEYRTGSYLMEPRNNWPCACGCAVVIRGGEKIFARIKCYGPVKKRSDGKEYQEKTYARYHLGCALKLTDLSPEEHRLVGEYFKTVTPQVAPKEGSMMNP